MLHAERQERLVEVVAHLVVGRITSIEMVAVSEHRLEVEDEGTLLK